MRAGQKVPGSVNSRTSFCSRFLGFGAPREANTKGPRSKGCHCYARFCWICHQERQMDFLTKGFF